MSARIITGRRHRRPARIDAPGAAAYPGTTMLKWENQDRGGESVFKLSGEITEEARLDSLADEIRPPTVVLDLEGIRRINSLGVRDWLRMVSAIEAKGVSIVLERVSVPVVYNLVSISGFEGHGSIRSVFAPYWCRRCDEEGQTLVQIGPGAAELATAVECRRCRAPMELNDLPELYDWIRGMTHQAF
jgi:eukaryotic-like serine/threonine-protein kinase